MEEYRTNKRDHSEDSKDFIPSEDHISHEPNLKRLKNSDLEKLKSTRSELLKKHFGYTDENNPFGDEQLTQPFVWEKNEKFQFLDKKLRSESPSRVVQSKVDELKQIKQRREQYELEKSRKIESRIEKGKSSDDDAYEQWEEKEIQFNLKQIVAKPLMRFKQGRPKLIDKLVLIVDPDFKESFSESFEVNTMFRDLSKGDLEESMEILKAFLELKKNPEFVKYFENLLVLAKEPSEKDYQMSGVSQMVAEKIDQILSTKSIEDLKVFEEQINKKLESKGVVDTNFWEAALSRIPYFKACKYVSDVLYKNSKVKSDGVGITQDSKDFKHTINESGTSKFNSTSHTEKSDSNIKEKEEREINRKNRQDYDKFVQYTKLEEDEEVFDEMVDLDDNNSNPEIPRYFNRVKKGFEWTKYNLAHYDQDHPPPKLVQGYRFNIFFPGLKGKVPKWKLQKDGNNTETALIRFIGGHPYKDIAFRVINKEWNTDPQKGFKNFFDNGVLHLYFDFKKIKYRR